MKLNSAEVGNILSLVSLIPVSCRWILFLKSQYK